jgi:hypothetical protein
VFVVPSNQNSPSHRFVLHNIINNESEHLIHSLFLGVGYNFHFDAEYVNQPRLILDIDGTAGSQQQPFNYTGILKSGSPSCRSFKLNVAVFQKLQHSQFKFHTFYFSVSKENTLLQPRFFTSGNLPFDGEITGGWPSDK